MATRHTNIDRVQAYLTTDGSFDWTYDFPAGDAPTSPVIAYGNSHLLFEAQSDHVDCDGGRAGALGDGCVFALDQANGNLLWREPSSGDSRVE